MVDENKKDENVVAGYRFENEETLMRAKREYKGIEELNEDLRGKKTLELLEAYKQLNEKRIFKTVVGFEYMKGLQKVLKSNPSIKKSEVPAVNVPRNKAYKKEEQDDNFKFVASVFINVILVILVIVMFIISYNNTPTKKMEAYKEQIENKYSAWEEELIEKESELNDREKR